MAGTGWLLATAYPCVFFGHELAAHECKSISAAKPAPGRDEVDDHRTEVSVLRRAPIHSLSARGLAHWSPDCFSECTDCTARPISASLGSVSHAIIASFSAIQCLPQAVAGRLLAQAYDGSSFLVAYRTGLKATPGPLQVHSRYAGSRITPFDFD